MTGTLLPTTVVGSYPQPDWLIDPEKLTHLPLARCRQPATARDVLTPGHPAARHKTFATSSPTSLVEAVIELGRRGIDARATKGLAETNPEKSEAAPGLETRSLSQVKISHTDPRRPC
jgi:hypothetical protein